MRKLLAVFSAAVIGLTFTACGAAPEYAGYCVDRTTQTRAYDSRCTDSNTDANYAWFYMLLASGNRVPAVGQPYSPTHGVYKVPASSSYQRGGLPVSGGKNVSSTWSKSTTGPGTTYKAPSKSSAGGGSKSGSSYKPSGGGYKPSGGFRR